MDYLLQSKLKRVEVEETNCIGTDTIARNMSETDDGKEEYDADSSDSSGCEEMDETNDLLSVSILKERLKTTALQWQTERLDTELERLKHRVHLHSEPIG